MPCKHGHRDKPVTIDALGKRWIFTPALIRLLGFYGDDPSDSLKLIIMAYGSMKDFEDGIYESNIFGISIRMIVRGKTVLVDDPFAPG
jgi:hypothetical protein